MISIIVPVYNVEKYLERCIESILNQTFKDFELILVNDGSKDKSGDICNQLKMIDSRIKVIHQCNKGLSAARNTGLENINGKYVMFIDSDDCIHNRTLEIMISVLEENNADICVADFCRFSDTKEIMFRDVKYNEIRTYSNISIQHQYFDSNVETARYVSACWKLYKRELFDDVRFPVGRLFEDEYVTYKIFDLAKNIVEIDIPLYFYYVNNSGITKNLTLDKKFDEYDAQFERIEYYKNSDYKTLYSKSLRTYLKTAQWDLIKCQNKNEICDKTKSERFVLQYKRVFKMAKEVNALDFIKDYDYYILANKRFTLFYRIKRKMLLFVNDFFK